jgi:MFS family permease
MPGSRPSPADRQAAYGAAAVAGPASTVVAAEPAARPGIPRWREVVADGRGGLTLGLCVVELLAGMQMLITSATMPKVLDSIGGLAFYGWVFSGYSLAGLAAIPSAGRDADRHGPMRPVALQMAIFAVGTVLCGLAPSMLVLAAARVVQGYGGGGLYTIAYAVVAKSYPERVRARMLALLTLVWVVSGLVGPGVGVAIAGAAGWRWSFLVSLPLVAMSALLVLPRIAATRGDPAAPARLPLRWPFQLAAGVGLGIAALSTPAWWSIPAGAAGVVMIVQSLPHLLPAGTFSVRPGLPATIALAFLLGLGFFTADSYVTLLLTGVNGRSVAEAGIAVSLVSISWSLSSWWQSRAVHTWSHPALVRLGAVLLAAGIAGTASALVDAPSWLVYSAWFVAGLGMGIGYPTLLIASMGTAGSANQATVVAARFVGGRLGMSLGTGLGGVSVALAAAAGAPLRAGLAGTFGLALAGALVSVALAGRVQRNAA